MRRHLFDTRLIASRVVPNKKTFNACDRVDGGLRRKFSTLILHLRNRRFASRCFSYRATNTKLKSPKQVGKI